MGIMVIDNTSTERKLKLLKDRIAHWESVNVKIFKYESKKSGLIYMSYDVIDWTMAARKNHARAWATIMSLCNEMWKESECPK